MKKKIFILFITLFLVGCSVDYNLVITDTRAVRENFEVRVNNEMIPEEYSSVNEFLDYFSSVYRNIEGNESYNIKTRKGNFVSLFRVNRNYFSIRDYINSNSFKSMFNDAAIYDEGSYLTFRTSNNIYLEIMQLDFVLDEDYYYEEFNINIKFYNNVVDHNADNFDERNNILTWVVTRENATDHIYFKIDGNVRYGVMIKDIIQTNLIEIIVITGVVGGAIIFVSYASIKAKKNNKI